jgi:AraC family transcriptional regulator, L-rhamnose operon transcriptional activator RhaR
MEEITYDVPDFNTRLRANVYANRVICIHPTEYHAHNYVEIAFVEEGNGIHKIANEGLPCSRGDLYLLNNQVKHQFIPDPGTELVISNCIFLPEFFDYSLVGSKSIQTLSNIFLFRSFLVDEPFPYIGIHVEDEVYPWLKSLVDGIRREYQSEEMGYLELIRAYMIELMIFILRRSQSLTGPGTSVGPAKDANGIIRDKVIAYIESHFTDDVTIGELSVLAFLSPAQLCRVFRQTTGSTVREFMQKTRIEVACRMLCETGKSITDISLSVGYRDFKYFTRLFTRSMGMTPSAFRKTCGKRGDP